ncbi:MMPL family transporter [Nonomuraea jabiensis]|uniref:MMPL family transporter n=1 Tax=Nonomuraea jabiensis TaxID=882448 RepID=UPI0036895A9B
MASVIGVLLPHPPGAPPVEADALVKALSADARVSLAVIGDNGRDLTALSVLTRTAADDERSVALHWHIQHELTHRLLPPGQPVFVNGPAATLADLKAECLSRLWQVIAVVLGCSLIFLSAAFRSLLLPIKAVMMNLLAVGAAFGLLSLSTGHFGGTANAVLPVLTFTLVFGLSMDYEVFMVHRIAEHYRRHGDNGLAVTHGLRHSARVITLAAAVIVITFASLLTAQREETRQLGFVVATAVALDATIIRLMLVPATMHLLGRRNWWLPRPLSWTRR